MQPSAGADRVDEQETRVEELVHDTEPTSHDPPAMPSRVHPAQPAPAVEPRKKSHRRSSSSIVAGLARHLSTRVRRPPRSPPVGPRPLRPLIQLVQRHSLLILWIASFVWNVLSPFKNWYLSRYEISGAEISLNFGMNWWDELDYKYVKFLYDEAGVPCFLREGQPTRLVNVYTDFMVLPRSTKWAHGISKWHQDALVGRYCQAGLLPQRDAQAAALQSAITNPSFQLWGKLVTNYIPDQRNCPLNQVPEAVLCLKGYNASQLINLEWSTGRDPSDPAIHSALSAWQQLVLPSLKDCIARREWLVTQAYAGDRDAALLALANELATNYSLNPFGYAGKKSLVRVFYHRAGFVDVNGYLSGVRKVSLSGSITERNRNNYDGDMNAVTAVREAMWCCLLDTTLPPSPSFEACLVREGLRLPALFLGDKLFRTKEELADRFIDDITLVQGQVRGVNGLTMTQWNYVPQPSEPLAVTYLETGNMSSVETAYQNLIDFPLVFEVGGGISPAPSTPSPLVVEYKCIYQPGCETACRNNTDRTTAMYMVYAVRKSGTCYRERFPPELINRNGFVSRECYGIGKGSSTLFFKLDTNATAKHGWQGAPAFVEIPNVADPNAILACIMGGRVPVKGDAPFPSGFQNMVSLGTGMVLTVIFGDGSERVLSNMYALVSLAGATMYAGFVLLETWRMSELVRRAYATTRSGLVRRQVSHSIAITTLSFRVWRLHYPYLCMIGFFTVFSWLLGASNTLCSWYVGDRRASEIKAEEMNLAVIPEYVCRGGDPVGHLSSGMELVRLLSTASVVCFIMLGRQHMVGASRMAVTLTMALFFYGFIPSLTIPWVVIGLNRLRLLNKGLALIHNQLVVGLLCGLMLAGWKRCLPLYDRVFVLPLLRLCGQRGQKIVRGVATRDIVVVHEYFGGLEVYWTKVEDNERTEWIPLSVFVEHLGADKLATLDFAARCFVHPEDRDNVRAVEPMGEGKMVGAQVPTWVLEADEFHVRMSSS
ncbi:hypothetical protein ATCC90586_007565 [Pythium insidiosum]|nr:hypothetical protein ATCC90586_007565 [Pythium insidiosum]